MGNTQYDPEQAAQRKQQQVEHQTATQAGADRARSSGLDPRELLSEEWMDTVNDLDVDRELPDTHPAQHNVATKLGAHTSKQVGIGNISREEYESEQLKDRGRRRLLNSQYRRRGGTGAKCTGRTRERMTTGDQPTDRPLLTDDLSDQLDAAFEAKRMQRSGSIGGRRFAGSTEVQVVTKSEGGFEVDSGSGGMLSTLTGGLFG